ncbi:riboflavin transporter 2-like isoform X2 [Montipora capricornis]|uniref:riboflavin transporter 2-like isoform X2 n=1 Tax=Montipora capricornis TaxID=246305 RepID=UPI0035F206E4
MALERLINKIKYAFTNVSVVTYALVVIFGTGSWIAINGLWVELPIIVKKIPEGWSLPSYLTVMIQLANIAPLAFTLGNKFFPRVVTEVPVIYISVLVGVASCALLAFFWKETTFIVGAERSTALLALCFFLSMVDCTSSVAFIPYMAIFREVYMSPYFAGEGLSGLLPSLVAIIQGVGGGDHTPCVNVTETSGNTTNGTSGNETDTGSWGPGPKFSAEVFFWFLSAMMMACGLAFLGLNHLPVVKREHVNKKTSTLYHRTDPDEKYTMELVPAEQNSEGKRVKAIANPVTCVVFPFIRTTSTVLISFLTVVYIGMCTYVIVIATQSPSVLLRCEDSGAALIVAISVSAVAVVTYVKVAIGGIMREMGRNHLLWFGAVTQVGSCIGALSIFAPVNVYGYFKQE